MKHFIIGVIALVLCLGMSSCKKEAANEPQNEPAAQEQAVEAAPSLADVVAKAKAEGANWSVDEWKAQVKEFLLAIKPVMLEMESVSKRMESEPDKIQEIMGELKGLEEKYSGFSNLVDEFTQIATSTANGKTVIDDEEWLENLREELGVPEM